MEAGEILVRRGLIDERQLAQARVHNQEGGTLVDAAVSLGFVKEEEACKPWGPRWGWTMSTSARRM